MCNIKMLFTNLKIIESTQNIERSRTLMSCWHRPIDTVGIRASGLSQHILQTVMKLKIKKLLQNRRKTTRGLSDFPPENEWKMFFLFHYKIRFEWLSEDFKRKLFLVKKFTDSLLICGLCFDPIWVSNDPDSIMMKTHQTIIYTIHVMHGQTK